mmetsp:Transcript_23225/g.54380  ORF Transcript_23225/g.54380 Transcript_23225/m.54380 type:complete len:386 (-) Transcript_23225:111-1268(-)
MPSVAPRDTDDQPQPWLVPAPYKLAVDVDSSSGDGGATQSPEGSGDGWEDTTSGHGSGSGSGFNVLGIALEDAASRDDNGSSLAANEDDALAGLLPSLRKDGASANSGSAGHPDECKPCAFYCYSLRGCRNGDKCSYCHLFHQSRLRQRREEWKRTQREKRRRQRDKRCSVMEGPQDCLDAKDPALVAVLPEMLPAAAGNATSAPAVVVGPASTGAQVRTSGAAPAACVGEVRQRPTSPPAPQLQPQLAQRSWTEGVVQHGNTQLFAYTPNSVVIAQGQMVELWPPLEMVTQGMIFAVSPDLPQGLTLDERVGVIYGRPQECTAAETYFVTACEPGDTTFSVKISVVKIKVIQQRPLARPAADPRQLLARAPCAGGLPLSAAIAM